MGKNSAALEHYKSCLAMAKCSGDKVEIGIASGHIGSLFGVIGK